MSSFDAYESGWRVQRGRSRSFAPLLYALVGALVGGLIVLLSVPYLQPLLPGTEPGAAAGARQAPAASSPPPEPRHGDDSPVVQVAEATGPAVVGIINYRRVTNAFTGESRVVEAATGSGVIFDRRGYVVTNYHVAREAVRLEVILGDREQVEAELVAHDFPFSDLAVLKIDPAGRDLAVAEFGDSDAVRVGETVVAIGNPKGLQFFRSLTVGVVSGVRSDLIQQLGRSQYNVASRIFEVIQTDAAINGGNSGGPLVNLRGEVIGINTLKFAGEATEGMGFALPSNAVERIVSDLIEHGYVVRPALGVQIVPDEQARVRYGVEEGVLVGGVMDAAAEAGLRPGDIIRSVDGQRVDTFLELVKEISARRVGDVVHLQIQREQETIELDVTLGRLERPQE